MRVPYVFALGPSLLALSSCMTDFTIKPGGTVDLDTWSAIRQATRTAPQMDFHQAWEKASSFARGYVKVVREESGLLVYAHLDDAEIYNDNTTFNAPFFMEGDVFEMFIRPEGQEAYFELHIGPQNQQMQLKIESSKKFYEKRKTYPPVEELIGPYRIEQSRFQSRTRVKDGTWEVAARLPYRFLSSGVDVNAKTLLHVNFSRYDYTKGAGEPVYSATASLSKLDFHHQPDWDRLIP